MKIVIGQGHPDFLDLPWDVPLAEWEDDRLVKMAHGISRHVVRFALVDGDILALKELPLDIGQRYRFVG